jgi:hypothetical protein
MYCNVESNDLSPEQPLEIHVWRGDGKYELYEDDGETKAYLQGKYAITSMEVQEYGNELLFTISQPDGDRSVVPTGREFTVRFRDVISAEIAVNGEPVANTDLRCVTVPARATGKTIVIRLSNCVFAKNIPLEESTVELLTRVQAANGWKGTHFRDWRGKGSKMPQFIKGALAELKLLDYSIY